MNIKLRQLCLAYTIQKKLPAESVKVNCRVKSLESVIKKLEKKNWPQFYYPTDVIKDLIGARIICWFIDDCYEILEYIKESNQLFVDNSSIKDYILKPKDSGYRSIHLLANIPYDSVKNKDGNISVVEDQMICEIQIRSKLQDAWGDITHEFHYKAKLLGIENENYEKFLSGVSERLNLEDKTLVDFRKIYQTLADEKTKLGIRKGFDS